MNKYFITNNELDSLIHWGLKNEGFEIENRKFENLIYTVLLFNRITNKSKYVDFTTHTILKSLRELAHRRISHSELNDDGLVLVLENE